MCSKLHFEVNGVWASTHQAAELGKPEKYVIMFSLILKRPFSFTHLLALGFTRGTLWLERIHDAIHSGRTHACALEIFGITLLSYWIPIGGYIVVIFKLILYRRVVSALYFGCWKKSETWRSRRKNLTAIELARSVVLGELGFIYDVSKASLIAVLLKVALAAIRLGNCFIGMDEFLIIRHRITLISLNLNMWIYLLNFGITFHSSVKRWLIRAWNSNCLTRLVILQITRAPIRGVRLRKFGIQLFLRHVCDGRDRRFSQLNGLR